MQYASSPAVHFSCNLLPVTAIIIAMKRLRSTWLLSLITGLLLSLCPVYAMTPEEAAEQTESDHMYIVDDDTGQVLFDKYGTDVIYPASMTKLMTVLVAAESLPDPEQEVTITYDMLAGLAEANASVVGYRAGVTVSVRSLLYGALLPSGADAVNALGFTVSGSIPAFVDRMNQKAAELGMNSTHFVNPTGLHDPDHYTTCSDLAVLMSACHRIPLLHEIMTTPVYTDEAGYTMRSTAYSAMQANGVEIAGYNGGKTGYTNAAGHCLASYLSLNDMHLIVIAAHAMTPYADWAHVRDTAFVADWMNQEYSRRQVLYSEQSVQTVTLKHMFKEETTEVLANSPIWFDLRNDAGITWVTDIPQVIEVGVEDRTVNGTITVLADGVPIAAQEVAVSVPREPKLLVRILMRIRSLFVKEEKE